VARALVPVGIPVRRINCKFPSAPARGNIENIRPMLRFIAVLLSVVALLAAATPDKNALIAKLQRDLDKAMSRGTPTDKEILELKKSRQDLNSPNHEDFSVAIDTIDRIAHTQSFRPPDASDVKKDIGNIRGHKSFLFLRLP
jgi:hypothetical protein